MVVWSVSEGVVFAYRWHMCTGILLCGWVILFMVTLGRHIHRLVVWKIGLC